MKNTIKRLKRVPWWGLALGLLALILATSLPKALNAQQDCVEDSAKVLAQHQVDGNTYILYRTLDPNGATEKLAIKNPNGVCSLLNKDEDDIVYPLSHYTSKAIALELNKAKWQRIIREQGGKAKFERGFADHAKTDDKHYMPSDSYEALQALSISIPENIHPYDQPPKDIPLIEHD